MKNKIIYLFVVIFSLSLVTSAKKIQGTCNRKTVCTQVERCEEPKQTEAVDEAERTFPTLGLLLLNI